MARFTSCTLAAALIVSCTALSVFGNEPAENTPPAPPRLFRYVDSQERATLLEAASGGGMMVKERNFLIRAVPVAGGAIQSFVLIAAGSGEQMYDSAVKDLKKGDYVTIDTEKKFNNTYVLAIGKYDLKPGEDQPNIFIVSGIDLGDKDTRIIHLLKFEQQGIATVPASRKDLIAIADRLKQGDSVEISGHPAGKGLELSQLSVYCPPAVVTVAEITDQDVDGGQSTALKATMDDSTEQVLLVPGKLNGKGVFVPDPSLLAKIKHLKTGTTLRVKFYSDGDKFWLKSAEVVSR